MNHFVMIMEDVKKKDKYTGKPTTRGISSWSTIQILTLRNRSYLCDKPMISLNSLCRTLEERV